MDPTLKKQIEKSGNNLHMEIVELLESNSWIVDLSSYYYDDTTDKPREIDVVAKKKFCAFEGQSPDDHRYYFHVFLFIECKYLTDEVAFRMHGTNPKSNEDAVIIECMDKEKLLKAMQYAKQNPTCTTRHLLKAKPRCNTLYS